MSMWEHLNLLTVVMCCCSVNHVSRILWAHNSEAYNRDGPKTRWQLHQHLRGDIIAGEQMLMSKSTSSSLQSMLQSTVVIAVFSDYFKVAILKRSKVRIVLSYFLLQPAYSAIRRYVQHSKQPPIVTKFSGDGPFELCFECNWDLTFVFSWGKTEGAECIGNWMPFVNAHMRR